jgi:hypothetical protein
MTSGTSFKDFFYEFETYCKQTFRSHEDTWIGELGRCLSGELKGAFLALKGPNDSYRRIKQHLLRWYEDSKEQCELETRRLFEGAKKEPDESLRLYAARLGRLFKLAHPSRTIETSKVLRKKFLSTVPKKFKRQLENALGISKTMLGVPLAWSKVVTLATHVDTRQEQSDTEEQASLKIWAGQVTDQTIVPTMRMQSVPRRDAVVQCNSPPRGSREIFSHREFRQTKREEESDLRPPRDSFCNYCERVGHTIDRCRRRLGLCLSCGAAGHRIADCPTMASSTESPRPPPRSPYGRAQRRTGRSVQFDMHRQSDDIRENDKVTPLNDRALV